MIVTKWGVHAVFLNVERAMMALFQKEFLFLNSPKIVNDLKPGRGQFPEKIRSQLLIPMSVPYTFMPRILSQKVKIHLGIDQDMLKTNH